MSCMMTYGQFLYLCFHFRHFHFDLWVEKTRLVVNMTLPGAVAALLHLVFIFDLRYPEVFYNLMLLLLK